MSFAMYNGSIYRVTKNIFTKNTCMVTQFKEKTDDTFYEYLDYLDRYAKDVEDDDLHEERVRRVAVEFYVVYNDTSKTMEAAAEELKAKEAKGRTIGESDRMHVFEHTWEVSEDKTYRLPAKIENDEVSIAYHSKSCSEDWLQLKNEPGEPVVSHFCGKIVDIHDCEKLVVKYYYGRDNVQEVVMEPDEFKAEMLKYRISNI